MVDESIQNPSAFDSSPAPTVPSRIPARFAVGEKAIFSRTFTEADAALFIGVTWDVSAYHTNEDFARQTRFGRRILPGLLVASMATHLGGMWTFLATKVRFEFVNPVYAGDTITLEAEIVEVRQDGRSGKIRCHFRNSDGVEVIRGQFCGRFTPPT